MRYINMSTLLVEKENTIIRKDCSSSILMQHVIYHSESVVERAEVAANFSAVLPDVFEITVRTPAHPQKILDDIVTTVNNISFRRYDDLTCPNCDSVLINVTGRHGCNNVDCIIDDDIVLIMCIKFKVLTPNIPSDIIIDTIHDLRYYDLEITPSNIIQYTLANPSSRPKFTDAIHHITLEQFFRTIVDARPHPDFVKVINYYNNSIINIVEQCDSISLNEFDISNGMKNWIKHALRVNHTFLSLF